MAGTARKVSPNMPRMRARMAGGEVGLLARDREKALEAGFFAQVEAAKEEQKRATEQRQREIVSLSGGLLDMDLGGVDVDALLQSLKEIPADPNVFPTLAAHARDMDAPAAAPPSMIAMREPTGLLDGRADSDSA